MAEQETKELKEATAPETTTSVSTETVEQPIVEKLTSILCGLTWNKTSDGTPVICAILKNSRLNLSTKSTIRSYLTALEGPSAAISYVKSKLESGEVEILSGAIVTWERTTYAAGLTHERAGQTVILDKIDVIDHILKIDLEPICEVLLLKYLEEYEGNLSSLQEKLLQKSFGVKFEE